VTSRASSHKLHGVGIGLRREFHDAILSTNRTIDWLEIVSENFLTLAGRSRYVLDACRERWPIVAHGVAASLGTGATANDRDRAYDAQLAKLTQHIGGPFFSDHLCYSSVHGHESFDLLPLPFTQEAADVARTRALALAEQVGQTMLLENITYYATMPSSTMSEGEFVRTVLDGSTCGLLLDINNVYVNARNHGQEPLAMLMQLPLDRVRQIHLAGHTFEQELLLDTHSRPVADPVWALFESVIAHVGPVPTLIEWDQQIPSLDAVIDEADKARQILARYT
jgi:uncharacterized protein